MNCCLVVVPTACETVEVGGSHVRILHTILFTLSYQIDSPVRLSRGEAQKFIWKDGDNMCRVTVRRRAAWWVLWSFAVFVSFAAMGAASELLQKGELAPDFPADTEWFGGSACKLSDLAGKKAVLLYFLQPGCGSCDNFAPHLYRLALQNKDDLAVIGLTSYPKKDEVESYAQKRMGDYPVAWLPDKSYVSRYIGSIKHFPYIVLIGKDGRIKWFGRGKFHEQVTEELERTLGRLPESRAISAGKRAALIVSASEGENGTLQAPLAEGKAIAVALRQAGYDPVVALGGEEAPATADSIKKELKILVAGATSDKDAALFFYTGDARQTGTDESQAGLTLLVNGDTLALSELHAALPEGAAGKMLWVIDADHEDSKLPEWGDIGAAVSSGLPGVTLMLAASRYDRSRLAVGDSAGTLFGKLFIELLQSPVGRQDLTAGWRFIRDGMCNWSRVNNEGILQSPFIYNPGTFSLLPESASVKPIAQ